MVSLAMIAAGVTALPLLLVGVTLAPIVAVLSVVPLALLVFRSKSTITNKKEVAEAFSSSSSSCNVIITGGSSGIGLAIAKECTLLPHVKRITLIARNLDKLKEAKASLEKAISTTTTTEIQIISACVTDAVQMSKAALSVKMESTTYLLPCAGVSHPGYFSELSPQVFEDQIKINYLGSVFCVKAFLPRMKRGCITLISSGAGQVGLFGFSAYSPSKFALRGLAECLHMELAATASSSSSPIHVQIAFPVDTKTPGYEREQELKPTECHLMSESGGLLEPKDVAKKILMECMAESPKFQVTFGLEGWMLGALTAGMGPESSLTGAVTQVALMGFFRLISMFYLNEFWNIVRQQHADKRQKEESAIQKE